ncbi:MAG TPA: YbbR-like domain-containing protein [Bacteroidales bacterium]|nr:YbbR-like domain-containing protein [Bacteroidales bacterium]
MNHHNGIWWKRFSEKGGSSKNRDLVTFSFFLLLSFILWYLNSLEKDIEYEMKYQVSYVNLPENRVLADESVPKLNVFLKGPGYSILKIKLAGSRAPVEIDISSISYRRVPGSRTPSYYILSSSLVPKLRNFLDSECDVTSIKPDTLFFTLDRIISKKVRVVPDLDITPARQYLIKGGLKVSPDTVTVKGPKRIVDTIHFITTRYRRIKSINESETIAIGLESIRGLSFSSKKVHVTIPVEQFTEAEFRVPVKLLNSPDSVNVRIFPDMVTVKCMVAVSDYRKIREVPFDAVIDLSEAALNSSEKLQVGLRNIPPFISSLRVSPAKVDFLLEKKRQR